MSQTRYRVLRVHEGDRRYEEGDERVAASSDVKHLLGTVLEEIGPAEKAEPAVQNKADEPPQNKAPAKAITTPKRTKS